MVWPTKSWRNCLPVMTEHRAGPLRCVCDTNKVFRSKFDRYASRASACTAKLTLRSPFDYAQAYWVNPRCPSFRVGAKPFFARVSSTLL